MVPEESSGRGFFLFLIPPMKQSAHPPLLTKKQAMT